MASISVAVPSGSTTALRQSAGRGIFRTVLDAIMLSRQIKANKEIAEILARRRLADD